MEKMITFYCKANNISYIQGMNEVMTPFLYSFKDWEDMEVSKVFNFFSWFMHVFIPTFYSDPEFLCL